MAASSTTAVEVALRIATLQLDDRLRGVNRDTRGTAQFGDGSDAVIGACIEVHRQLGPGLLESTYEPCLCHELTLRGISFRRQVPVPLSYKGLSLDCAYRMDLLVDEKIVVELKVVERLLPVHAAQALTYLRLTGLRTALLVNFNVPVLRLGLRRLTNNAFAGAHR